MLDIINYSSTFPKVNIPDQKLTIKLKDKLNNQLRKLNPSNWIDDSFYNAVHTSGSKIGSLYGLPKVHRPHCPIRPILPACSSRTFQLGTAPMPYISYLATNEYILLTLCMVVCKVLTKHRQC